MPQRSSSALTRGLILTMDAAVLELRSGPMRLLLALRKMAGTRRHFRTRTKSLATLFGCTTNTIRNWRNELVLRGYIHWITDPLSGVTTIMIRLKAEPPERRNQEVKPSRKLWWMEPRSIGPKSWWKFGAGSRTGGGEGGAKFSAPIKAKNFSSLIQPPLRTVEEQLRLLMNPA